MLNHVCCYVVYMLAISALKFNRHLKCLYIRNTRMCFMTDLCALYEWSYSLAKMCQQQSLPMMQNKSGVGHQIALLLNQLLSGVSVKCYKLKPKGVFQFLIVSKYLFILSSRNFPRWRCTKNSCLNLEFFFFSFWILKHILMSVIAQVMLNVVTILKHENHHGFLAWCR